MKRFLPYLIVGLMILVPTGVVLASKTVKKQTVHRSAKQKAANEKLTQELLTIMEETDNKMTFAACVECLTQLKPEREVVVPAIIRKADKMGWLRADGADDCAMIGDCLLQFLQRKHPPMMQPTNFPYGMQYPCPCPCPMPTPQAFVPPPCVAPPSPYTSYPMSQPMCPPNCQPGGSCPMPCAPPPPPTAASTWRVAPLPSADPIFVPTSGAAQDKMTVELLKILEETESKVTFALIVETLDERCDNWDLVIPTIIRKADKMGWMKAPDKDFGDKFTENLAELIGSKVKRMQKDGPASCPSTPSSYCPSEPTCQPRVTVGGCPLTGIVGSITFAAPVVAGPAVEVLTKAHCHMEVLPMPRPEAYMTPSESDPRFSQPVTYPKSALFSDPLEMLPMPHREAEVLPKPHLSYERIDGGIR
jgi:hypothetical protein